MTDQFTPPPNHPVVPHPDDDWYVPTRLATLIEELEELKYKGSLNEAQEAENLAVDECIDIVRQHYGSGSVQSVDVETGLGWADVPWDLSTMKDRARETARMPDPTDLINKLTDALREMKAAVKSEPAMNHHKYDLLGITVNEALKQADRWLEGRKV